MDGQAGAQQESFRRSSGAYASAVNPVERADRKVRPLTITSFVACHVLTANSSEYPFQDTFPHQSL